MNQEWTMLCSSRQPATAIVSKVCAMRVDTRDIIMLQMSLLQACHPKAHTSFVLEAVNMICTVTTSLWPEVVL
jgi:hypothetical protein